VARPPFGQHAVTVAEHVHRVDGADHVPVQRQLVARRLVGVRVRVRDGGGVVDEHERECHGGQSQADGHQVRRRETQVDHHDAVDDHAQYAARGQRAADRAVLDGAPLFGRRVGNVRVDAVEQHRRAAGERERDRLHGGGQRGRHGPVDDAVQRQHVRRDLTGDRQQHERPPTAAVPVAPRAREHDQRGGYELLERRLPAVDGRHHVLRLRLVVAFRAHPLGHRARRVARLVQQQVRAQAAREHHRDEVHEHHRFHRHFAL